MSPDRTQLGWRALVGVGLCGTLMGFAIPAIAASLVRRERQQPSVRLIPAPRLPESEIRPSPSNEATPSVPTTLPHPRGLGVSKAQRAALKRLAHSNRAAAGERAFAPTSGSAAPPPSPETPAPSQSQSTHPNQDTQASNPKPNKVNGNNGGNSAPVTTPSHK